MFEVLSSLYLSGFGIFVTSFLHHNYVTVMSHSYHIHIDAVGVRPGMLEVFFKSLSERIGDLVTSFLLHNYVIALRHVLTIFISMPLV